jgi:hypothetical protein
MTDYWSQPVTAWGESEETEIGILLAEEAWVGHHLSILLSSRLRYYTTDVDIAISFHRIAASAILCGLPCHRPVNCQMVDMIKSNTGRLKLVLRIISGKIVGQGMSIFFYSIIYEYRDR